MPQLTDSQKEAIRAAITTDQRVEFDQEFFFVYFSGTIRADQFAHLTYQLHSVSSWPHAWAMFCPAEVNS